MAVSLLAGNKSTHTAVRSLTRVQALYFRETVLSRAYTSTNRAAATFGLRKLGTCSHKWSTSSLSTRVHTHVLVLREYMSYSTLGLVQADKCWG
jgi:hypothetical protein